VANCVFSDTDLGEFPKLDIVESPSLGDIRHQEDFKFLIQATIEHLSRQTAASMQLWITSLPSTEQCCLFTVSH